MLPPTPLPHHDHPHTTNHSSPPTHFQPDNPTVSKSLDHTNSRTPTLDALTTLFACGALFCTLSTRLTGPYYSSDCLVVVKQTCHLFRLIKQTLPLSCQYPRVPLVPRLTSSGDTRHFDKYEELPDSYFRDIQTGDNHHKEEFVDF